MRNRLIIALLLCVGAPVTAPGENSTITEAELVRRTQELFDALVPGNQAPWKKVLRGRLPVSRRERTQSEQGETGRRHLSTPQGILRLDQGNECGKPVRSRRRCFELRSG